MVWNLMKLEKILFRLYNGMPPLFKRGIKVVYKLCFERPILRIQTHHLQQNLNKMIKSYKVERDDVYVELNNDLSFYIPKTSNCNSNSTTGAATSFHELICDYPLITEIPCIIFDSTYEKYFPLKKGFVVVDVGANIGLFAIKASKSVGPKGKVIAIEPEKRNMKLLKKNAALNNCHNIFFVEKAVSDSKGETKMSLSDSATHTLFPENLSDECKGSVTVKTDTLEGIIAKLKVSKIDFVKMDIEGAEIMAVNGAVSLLKKQKPYLSIAAYHHVNNRSTYKSLVPLLQSINYNIRKGSLPHIYASQTLKRNAEYLVNKREND